MAELKKYLVGVTNHCAINVATVGGVTLPKRDKFGVGTLALLTESEKNQLVEQIKKKGFTLTADGRPVDCDVTTPGCQKLAEYAFVEDWDDDRDPEAMPATIIYVDRSPKPQKVKSKAESRKEAADQAKKEADAKAKADADAAAAEKKDGDETEPSEPAGETAEKPKKKGK